MNAVKKEIIRKSSDLCEFPQVEKLSVKALICVSSHKLKNYP
ncbi:hypothetical protein LEP1GSC081_3328 [Leptospira kirschneri str. H1]|uniref:Uncharacterized protein n=1 Tax=Leptospira kirschneri str. H1 TaxID=1049966 RepID=A0A0E2B2Y9_9LEPT|nr:hypothetical protein LEP1GSC081_3328 [Leptospira kirschneri str. H1]